VIVSDVITRVQRQFGDEASVQIEEADIIRWINDCAKEIAVQSELTQATANQNTVVNTNIYTAPADMLAVRSVYYDGKKLTFLERTEYDAYVNQQDPQEILTGTPYMYTRNVLDLLVYPRPDSVKVLKIWYFQRPTEVVNETDPLPFPVEYHLRIVEYCLQQAYQTDEDWDAAGQMKGQFDDGLVKLKQLENDVVVEFYQTITVLPEDSGF
jgi:hypothetical protein